jgi:hypothetical protein
MELNWGIEIAMILDPLIWKMCVEIPAHFSIEVRRRAVMLEPCATFMIIFVKLGWGNFEAFLSKQYW